MATQGVKRPREPIAALRSLVPPTDKVHEFGRQILADHLLKALRFLECQTAAFHTSRMGTIRLEKDQSMPTVEDYAELGDGAFFVLTRLNGAEDTQRSRR